MNETIPGPSDNTPQARTALPDASTTMPGPLAELRAHLAYRQAFAGDAEFGDMAAASRDYVKFTRWLTAVDEVVAEHAHTVRVCDTCWAPIGTAALHRVTIPAGPEDGTLGCLWPCAHDVQYGERECSWCRDTSQDPF
jgi:hypothetical protein